MMRKIYFAVFIYLFINTAAGAQTSQDWSDKWMAYSISSALEPGSKTVIRTAKAITENYPGGYSVAQACAVFDYLFNNWIYMRDPGGKDYFEEASIGVKTLTGDCDDYAITMVSLLGALGGDGRIICVSGHAYPELYVGKNLTEDDLNDLLKSIKNYYQPNRKVYVNKMHYHKDSDNTVWLNLDWQENYPGGMFVDETPNSDHLVIYSNGKYRRAYLNSE
ncbi:MAG TPA: hypothetical protein VGK25_00155 [Ignavibacteria bacterium]